MAGLTRALLGRLSASIGYECLEPPMPEEVEAGMRGSHLSSGKVIGMGRLGGEFS